MGMLRNGVSSEATLCRVERGIDELSMAERMREFAQNYHARVLKGKAGMEIICVDGKALPGTVLANGGSTDIVDMIRKKGGDFLIELKANQRELRYGIEDRIRTHTPLYSYTEGPELGHGRIETRIYRIHDGLAMIADREKWGGRMTVVEYESDTISKSTGAHSTERRLYVTSLAATPPCWALSCERIGP